MENNINIEHYIALIIKRRWLIIVPFCISMAVGIYLSFTLPRLYRAETLIMVEPQRVPASYVRPLTQSDVSSRISTLSQQVMSRTNLEKIIKRFHLFADEKYKDMFLEDKIAALRKRIDIKVTASRSRRGPDTFSISFEGHDPEKVMKVTNALATYFIDQNLKIREAQAVGTSKFLERELSKMRKKLKETEAKLKKFRSEHMGELPEQLDANLNILDRLQLELGNRMENLKDAKDRLQAFELSLSTPPLVQGNNTPRDDNMQTIEQLQLQLANLRAKYTEQHPDIIRLKNRIKKLKEEQEHAKATKKGEDISSAPELISPVSAQRMMLKNEIKNIEDDIARIRAKIKEYQIRVENTPKIEQELLNLKRDYNNMTEAYNSLLSRKIEAQIAVNMEEEQKGERFRVIDPASLPEKPVFPNLKKLFLVTLVIGLGLGGGVAFLLDYLDTTIKGVEDIEQTVGIPVLATVPVVYHPKDKLWRKIELTMFFFVSLVSTLLFTGFGVISFLGVNRTMEIVQKFYHT